MSHYEAAPARNVNSGSNTRFLDDASGDVVVTGIGFRPLIVIIEVDDSANAGSIGVSVPGIFHWNYNRDVAGVSWVQSGASAKFMSGADGQYASVSAVSDDGFTLSWVHVNGGAHTALTVRYTCIG